MSKERPDSPLESTVPEPPVLLSSYDLDLEGLLSKLRSFPNLRTVGLQAPDGLRDYATDLASWIERELSVVVVVSADPSFGACDVALNLKGHVDVLVHLGHTAMPSVREIPGLPVLFIPALHRSEVRGVVVEAARLLPGRRVGLLTTAQHSHKIEEACEALRSEGFEPVVGVGDNRVSFPGQLLGCNFTSATSAEPFVDGFVYLGSGDFHPLVVLFGTRKPVILADPYTGEVREITEKLDLLLRQRFAAIERARGARRFGILVSLRIGQERMPLARGLKRLIEREGRKATIIALDHFSWENLQYFRHLDAFVNTGCPRVTTDDFARYPLPLLTPQELEIVLGRRRWEEYAFDEFKGTKPAPSGERAVVRYGSATPSSPDPSETRREG